MNKPTVPLLDDRSRDRIFSESDHCIREYYVCLAQSNNYGVREPKYITDTEEGATECARHALKCHWDVIWDNSRYTEYDAALICTVVKYNKHNFFFNPSYHLTARNKEDNIECLEVIKVISKGDNNA